MLQHSHDRQFEKNNNNNNNWMNEFCPRGWLLRVRCKPADPAWRGPLTPYPGLISRVSVRSCAHRCQCFEQVELRCSPSARQCVISRVSQLPAVQSVSLTRINKDPVNSEETVSRLNLQRELNTGRNARAFSFWIYSNSSQLLHDSFRFCHLRNKTLFSYK